MYRGADKVTGDEWRVERHTFLGMPAVVASDAMARVLENAQRVARASVAVLITGETGSGKEIVARAIHQFSLRCSRPWVDINCGALPELLMESELFGHEKGAFSGADSAKAGLFELAHTGTLFLDEVGELDPRMQVKLLRVLDGVPYYRLGSQKKTRSTSGSSPPPTRTWNAPPPRADSARTSTTVSTNIRSTCRPCASASTTSSRLAEYFLAQHSEHARFTATTADALRQYAWPGNIRELRNAVVNAVISARTYEIGVEDLPARVRSRAPRAPVCSAISNSKASSVMQSSARSPSPTATTSAPPTSSGSHAAP